MIPDQWYPIYDAKALRNRPVALRRFGERLVLWRDRAGQPVCMRDRCPHRGVALSLGRVRDGELECGYHAFRFANDGRCTAMPCEGPAAKSPKGMSATAFPVAEAHGLIWLFHGDADASKRPPIPWFDALEDRRWGVARTSYDWPLNFVRTQETNFDIHHTGVLHGSFAPVGLRLDPYHVEVDGNAIHTWGELRREGKDKGMAFRVDFRMPGVTRIELSPNIVLLAADAPIDDDNTWRHVRYYTRTTRVRSLDRLVSWLGLMFELYVVQNRQDLPMVRSQQPQQPDLVRDPLVRADAGIAAYLKLRRHLLAEAQREARPVAASGG